MFFEKKYTWALIFLTLSVSACGYQFAGSGELPSGIRTVHVDMFRNNSSETGLENAITNDLIYEFTRKKKAALIKSAQSEGILTGVITSVRTDTVARQRQGESLTRRVTVSVNVKLADRTGKVIWFEDGMRESEAFDVVADKQAGELEKRDAIHKASKRLAERIFNRLTEDF